MNPICVDYVKSIAPDLLTGFVRVSTLLRKQAGIVHEQRFYYISHIEEQERDASKIKLLLKSRRKQANRTITLQELMWPSNSYYKKLAGQLDQADYALLRCVYMHINAPSTDQGKKIELPSQPLDDEVLVANFGQKNKLKKPFLYLIKSDKPQ